jgi:hypothetical protein
VNGSSWGREFVGSGVRGVGSSWGRGVVGSWGREFVGSGVRGVGSSWGRGNGEMGKWENVLRTRTQNYQTIKLPNYQTTFEP